MYPYKSLLSVNGRIACTVQTERYIVFVSSASRLGCDRRLYLNILNSK